MHRNIKRSLSIAVTVALGAVALTGCGLASNGGDGNAKETLTYWSNWSKGEPTQVALAESFKEFTAETGIKVDVQWQGRDVMSKVVPRMNSGKAPDLVDGAGYVIEAALGPVDGLRDLTKLYDTNITGESDTLKDVIPPAMIGQASGTVGYPFLVPYTVSGVTLWYNDLVTTAWKDAPPATWDQFIKDMDKFKAEGRTPLSIEGSTVDNAAFWTWLAVTEVGGAGSFLAGAQDKTGAAYDSTAWVAATDALGRMISGNYVPEGWNGTKYPVAQAGWADQTIKSDVMAMGTWLPQETDESLKKEGKNPADVINYRSMAFPKITDNDKGALTVPAGLTGFAITSKAKAAKSAEKFLSFFMSKAQQEKFAKATTGMSTRSDVEAPAKLKDFAERIAKADSIPTNWDGATVAEPKWYSDVLLPAIQKWWEGGIDSAEFRKVMKENTIAYHENK